MDLLFVMIMVIFHKNTHSTFLLASSSLRLLNEEFMIPRISETVDFSPDLYYILMKLYL